jgi:hypothetical protein
MIRLAASVNDLVSRRLEGVHGPSLLDVVLVESSLPSAVSPRR